MYHVIVKVVMLVLWFLALVVVGLFCVSVMEEERSKMRKGGDKVTPSSDMFGEEQRGQENN